MKNFVLLALSLIMFIACQDDLNIPDTGRKIVINGLITTDSLLNVFINKSVFITNNSNIYMSDLDNAEVCFYQNNACIDSLHHFYKVFDGWHVFHPGNYWSKSVFPLPGEEYKIVVKVPGLPDATATTTIPNLVRIERIDTSRIMLVTDNGPDFRMRYNIEFTDPANETNYYLFNLSNTFSKMFSCNPFPFVSQDPIVEEELSRSNHVEALVFSDKIINGQKHSLTVTTDGYNSGRNITTYFRLFSITEKCFKYIQTLNLYFEKQGNPLAEPITMYSNVAGGYGIFTGAAVSSDSIVIPY